MILIQFQAIGDALYALDEEGRVYVPDGNGWKPERPSEDAIQSAKAKIRAAMALAAIDAS